MTAIPSPSVDRRVKVPRAVEILGLDDRRVQQKAERGQLPGAIKIDGQWTFSETKLFAYLDDLEREQCATRQALATEQNRNAPRARSGAARARFRTPTGAASRPMRPSTPASKSRESPSAGLSDSGDRFDQAISMLRDRASKRAAKG
jgi:hypothetical protein